MLELVHVAKTYPSPGDDAGVCVLKDIDLKVKKGKSLVIVGPSGILLKLALKARPGAVGPALPNRTQQIPSTGRFCIVKNLTRFSW